MIGKVYVNNWMQVTTDKQPATNFNGLLEDLNGVLEARENKWDHLGYRILALSMQFAVRCRSKLIERFEGLIEAALFFIAAIESNGFNGIIGCQQALSCPIDALADYVCMNGRFYQLVKSSLELFAIYGEFSTNGLNGMVFIECLV